MILKLLSNTPMICMIFKKVVIKMFIKLFIKVYDTDDMIAAMPSNKNLIQIVTELFIRGRKLNNSLVFISKSYFAVAKKN